ncbi:MAG: hypothetical protein FWF65_00970 [Bacteroidetes bacterium]|nr:hypothetical protein [Bacteroidota bacterium]
MCVLHFLRLVKLGAPKDLSEESGNVPAGVLYSNTVAMLPNHKESAYMHLPTFTAGAMFHIGTFLALFCFVLLFFKAVWGFFFQHELLSLLVALYMWFSVCCGKGLIIKRVISKKLRPISNADDYISVSLTALFQFATALLFTTFAFHDFFSSEVPGWIIIVYFVVSTLLFFYLPFGKLKHAVYYFAARYHLGFFYGRRGTWPPKSKC